MKRAERLYKISRVMGVGTTLKTASKPAVFCRLPTGTQYAVIVGSNVEKGLEEEDEVLGSVFSAFSM